MNDALPWAKSKSTGFASLDLTLELGSNVGILAVKRDRDVNKFVGWHNDVRISDLSHERRIDCVIEVEQYLSRLPQIVMPPAIMAQVEAGRIACREGKSVEQNPHPLANPAERTRWLQGWLETFGAAMAARAINAATATAKAMAQVESDLQYALARNTVYKLAIEYATELALVEANKDSRGDRRSVLKFLELFMADDSDATVKAFPDWPSFVSEKTGAALQYGNPPKAN